MLVIAMSIEALQRRYRKPMRVHVKSDCLAAIHVGNTLRSKRPLHNAIALLICRMLRKYGCTLVVTHVAGVLNIFPDTLSRELPDAVTAASQLGSKYRDPLHRTAQYDKMSVDNVLIMRACPGNQQEVYVPGGVRCRLALNDLIVGQSRSCQVMGIIEEAVGNGAGV